MLVLLRFLDSLRGALDDGVGDGFLHQVDLALPDQLHVRVRQRNQQLLLALFAQPSLPLLVGCGAGRD